MKGEAADWFAEETLGWENIQSSVEEATVAVSTAGTRAHWDSRENGE